MKPFKTIAIAALAASVGGVALTAAQADGFGWGKGHHAGRMGADFGPGFGPGPHKGGKFGRKGAKRLLGQFDLNEDGVITQAEIDEAVAARFAEADSNSDGHVDLTEFKFGFAERTKDMQVRAFQRLDADGDGTVTIDEFNTMSDRMFSRLDRDGNGELERLPLWPRNGSGPRGQGKRDGTGPRAEAGSDERPGHGPQAGGERGSGPRGFGQGGFGRGHGMGHPGHIMMGLFEQFDADGDGKVTRAEFGEVRGKLFASADTDNSGGFELGDFSQIWMSLNDQRAVRMFQSMDTDGDLKVTAQEHGERTANMLERLDRNGDDVITKADFKRSRRGKGGKDSDDRGGRREWRDHDRGSRD
ncbi:EF-hand domain-containing protein [Roseibium sp.]|uniref:EF-hand domain-containing protein n=1 Tax=Roseibium sp. TaxID=1936156 RepID=UPI003A97E2CF